MDSHLPLLDLVDKLARDWQAMDPADDRYAGLTYRCERWCRPTCISPATTDSAVACCALIWWATDESRLERSGSLDDGKPLGHKPAGSHCHYRAAVGPKRSGDTRKTAVPSPAATLSGSVETRTSGTDEASD